MRITAKLALSQLKRNRVRSLADYLQYVCQPL